MVLRPLSSQAARDDATHPPGTATVAQLPLADNPQDLAHQERLTATLLRCRPQLEPIASPEDLIARLRAELGVPVGITSWGPSAAEKSEVRTLASTGSAGGVA